MPMSQRTSRGRSRSRARSSRGRKRSRSASRSRYGSRPDTQMTTAIMRPRATGDTYRFSRWVDCSSVFNTDNGVNVGSGGTIVTAVNPNTIYEGVMSLSLLSNVSDFTNLFSEFKITALEYVLINYQETTLAVLGNQNAAGYAGPQDLACKNTAIYIGPQSDPLNNTTVAQCQQESNVMVRDYVNQGKPLIIKVSKPVYQTSAVAGLTNVGDAADGSGWLDTQNGVSVTYRGFFIAIQDAFRASGQATTTFPMYTVRCRVSMIFRGVR